ncbi:MAG: methyl-accepting chemotaxis protein [Deltaproteobacteria bacterium]|nr:methyl-accepting chemotaxis protein [Deltaproteobacteria bacterium]
MIERGIFDRRTQTLFALGQVVASLGFGFGVLGLVLHDLDFGAINLLPPLVGALGGGIALWLLGAGRERAGAWVLLSSALVAVTGSMMSMGGFSGQSPTIFVWPVLMAGLLLGQRHAFLAAALASVVQVTLGLLELGGLFSPSLPPTDPNLRILAVGVPVVVFWLVALLSWLSAKHLGAALEVHAQVLDHAEQELGPVADSLASSMEQLLESTTEVRVRTRELSRGAETQAAFLMRGRGSAEIVATSTRELAQRARDAQGATSEASRLLEEAVRVFQALNRRLEGIDEIVETMQGLAERTDILALNATLESARAGEYGRSFGLVADRVRESAELTGQAARRIGDLNRTIEADFELIGASVERVRQAIHTGERLATDTVSAMFEQETSSQAIVEALTELAISAGASARSAEQIAVTVDEQGQSVAFATESAGRVAALVEAIQRREKVEDEEP